MCVPADNCTATITTCTSLGGHGRGAEPGVRRHRQPAQTHHARLRLRRDQGSGDASAADPASHYLEQRQSCDVPIAVTTVTLVRDRQRDWHTRPVAAHQCDVNASRCTVARHRPSVAAAGATIQAAIDAAPAGDLILVAPGNLRRDRDHVQEGPAAGLGAGVTIINAVKVPAEKLQAWRTQSRTPCAPPAAFDLLPGQDSRCQCGNNEPCCSIRKRPRHHGAGQATAGGRWLIRTTPAMPDRRLHHHRRRPGRRHLRQRLRPGPGDQQQPDQSATTASTAAASASATPS